MASKPRAKDVITPEFRGSFVHLFSYENNPGTGQPSDKHSITMLFPKKSADWRADLPTLYANLCEALQIQYPNWQGLPPIFNDPMSKAWPVKDGDLPNDRGNILEGHPGHWVVRAASKNFNPQYNLIRINAQGQAEPVPEHECFSGCYFEAQVNAFFYDKGGNLGVAFGLNNVKWTRTGDSLGGGGQNAAAAWGVEPVQSAGAAAFQPVPPPVMAGVPAGVPPTAPAPVAPAPVPGAPAGAPPAAPAGYPPAAPQPAAPAPVDPGAGMPPPNFLT